jgi:hypothetical protein
MEVLDEKFNNKKRRTLPSGAAFMVIYQMRRT